MSIRIAHEDLGWGLDSLRSFRKKDNNYKMNRGDVQNTDESERLFLFYLFFLLRLFYKFEIFSKAIHKVKYLEVTI